IMVLSARVPRPAARRPGRVSAVGGGDGVGVQGDVAPVEAAEVLPQADGDAGLGEAGGDQQDGALGAGAAQVTVLQCGDGGVPADDGERLLVGDRGPGGDDAPEGGLVQEVPVPDDQVGGGHVGEHAGGGVAEQA